MSMYCPGDGQSSGMLIPGDRSQSTASRSGFGYGSGFRSSALTTLKIAVLAPIPIASDATITRVDALLRRIIRTAYRRSCNMGGSPQGDFRSTHNAQLPTPKGIGRTMG